MIYQRSIKPRGFARYLTLLGFKNASHDLCQTQSLTRVSAIDQRSNRDNEELSLSAITRPLRFHSTLHWGENIDNGFRAVMR
jgi:hypothetical protein